MSRIARWMVWVAGYGLGLAMGSGLSRGLIPVGPPLRSYVFEVRGGAGRWVDAVSGRPVGDWYPLPCGGYRVRPYPSR